MDIFTDPDTIDFEILHAVCQFGPINQLALLEAPENADAGLPAKTSAVIEFFEEDAAKRIFEQLDER